MAQRQYSEEAAREILKRAVSIDTKGADFSREQLEELAEELGISPNALAKAEESWLVERQAEAEQGQYEAERQAYNAYRVRRFLMYPAIFVILSVFFFLLDIVTGSGWWFYWPILGWGILLTIAATIHFFTSSVAEESRFDEWRQRRRLSQPGAGGRSLKE